MSGHEHFGDSDDVSERQTLSKLEEERDYSGALRELLHLEKERSLSPRELVLKGNLVQLASGHDLDLSEAESAYLKALEQEEEYMPAILDLAMIQNGKLMYLGS